MEGFWLKELLLLIWPTSTLRVARKVMLVGMFRVPAGVFWSCESCLVLGPGSVLCFESHVVALGPYVTPGVSCVLFIFD